MIRNLPPELDDAVRGFENRMAEVRTRLIRQRTALDAARSPAPPPEPVDHFDFDRPISSCVR